MNIPCEKEKIVCACGCERFYLQTNIITTAFESRGTHSWHECANCRTLYDDWGNKVNTDKESVKK